MSYIFLSKKTETNRIEEIELELLPTGEFSESLIVNLTQAEYDVLTAEEKQLKLIYNITDVSEDTVNEVPDGGTTGQVLSKNSDTDGDSTWVTPAVTAVVGLTQAAYDSLTPKDPNTFYYITDV